MAGKQLGQIQFSNCLYKLCPLYCVSWDLVAFPVLIEQTVWRHTTIVYKNLSFNTKFCFTFKLA